MKQFSRFALSSILAAGVALCGTQAFAQDNPPPDTATQPPAQGPMGGMGRRPMDPDQMLARMTRRYNLSADQQSQIKPILQDQQKQMLALRQDSSISPMDRRTKMQGLRTDSRSRIEAVLNDDQKKQFDQDQQMMEQRMQRRMQGGPAGPGGSPPPQ